MRGMLRWEKGGPAAYSIKGGAGDFNEGGESPRIIQATNTSPQVLFPSAYPPPTPFPSFLSVFTAFSFQLCRDLRPPPLPLAPPRFLTGSDCLKTPDSAEKKRALLSGLGGRGRERGGCRGAGGEEPVGTTQLNINPISWRQREER